MSEYFRNRRLDRRIPLGSACVELSVGGMTLHSAYVPGESEEFEVRVESPEGRVSRPPLVVRVIVRRCNAIDDGLYEIGVETVQIVG